MRRKLLLIIALAMLAVGVAGIVAISVGQASGSTPSPDPVANGRSIFFRAADLTGRPIPYQGGMMMRMACANCHGANGHGLYTMMFVSPNITYKNLTDPAGLLEPNGGRGPTYTDELIKRAITQGIDAEGTPLQWPMPRWLMSDADLNDVIAFLKTLP